MMKISKFSHYRMILPWLLLLILSSGSARAQEYFSSRKEYGNNHLIILHPSPVNLKRCSFLLDEEILQLPPDMQVVWLYTESGSSVYNIDFAAYPQFHFHRVASGIHPDSVYCMNSLTPFFKKVFRSSRGSIFNGGPDIPPSLYGHETSLLTRISDPERHRFELSFLFHLMGNFEHRSYTPLLESNPDYLVLGICLGMQSINIAAGGTLSQDIPSDLYGLNSVDTLLNSDPRNMHRNYHRNLFPKSGLPSYFPHPINTHYKGWMKELHSIKLSPYVLSSHHQALDTMGMGIEPLAWSADNLIPEAIGHRLFTGVMGVQFHPELQWIFNEAGVQLYPDKEKISITHYLTERESLEFHLGFWKLVSVRLGAVN
jgi:putative glutamine amidotransferase